MTLVKLRKRNPYVDLSRNFDNFFRDGFLSHWEDDFATSAWNPSIDVAEEDDSYAIRAEVPGLSKEDIEIEIKDDVLVLRGEKKEEKEEEGRRYHIVERRYGSFQRAFRLPENADPEGIEAKYKDGVLTLTVPKTAVAEPRKIDVNAG